MTAAPGEPVPDPGDREDRDAQGLPGLCPRCRHVQLVRSGRGSTFLLCGLSRGNPAYPKYPPQPVVSCTGFAR